MSSGAAAPSAATPGETDEVWPVLCSANPQLPAAAFCSVCHQPFSGKFLAVRQDGRAICFACARRDDVPVHGVRDAVERTGLFDAGWLKPALAMIFAPQRALQASRLQQPAQVVTFAFVMALFGYGVTLGWTYLLEYEAALASLTERAAELGWDVSAQALAWLPWGTLPVVAALRILLGGVSLHLAVRIARPNDASWPDTLRAWGLSNALLVLCVVPFVGPFASMILWISAMLGWFRERHGLGPFASLFAVLPTVIILSIVGPSPLT